MKMSNLILEDHNLFEGELEQMANDVADLLDKELSPEAKEKLKQAGEQQNEIVMTALVTGALSALGTALTINAVVAIVGEYGAIIIEKFVGRETNVSKALKAAYKWCHSKEVAIVEYLGEKTAGRFTKNKSIKTFVGAILFIVLLGGLGAAAGLGALKAIKGAKYGSAGIKAGKVLLKGKDIAHAAKLARGAFIAGVSPEVAKAIEKMALDPDYVGGAGQGLK